MKAKKPFLVTSSFVCSLMRCHSMRVLGATLIAGGSFAGRADAAISITNFSLTSTTVSFTISGTLPSTVPIADFTAIYFLNTDPANPGFVIPPIFTAPISYSETLGQNLDSDYPLFTGNSSWDGGDYFGLFFASNLAGGEAINGDVSATFAPGTFDPSEVSLINVVWGSGGLTVAGGTFLTTVDVVPEPSGLVLGLLGGPAFLRCRR